MRITIFLKLNEGSTEIFGEVTSKSVSGIDDIFAPISDQSES